MYPQILRNQKKIHLGESLDARNFIPKFATVIGGTVLLATVLHGIESAIGPQPIAF
jgi:hypothetical protein